MRGLAVEFRMTDDRTSACPETSFGMVEKKCKRLRFLAGNDLKSSSLFGIPTLREGKLGGTAMLETVKKKILNQKSEVPAVAFLQFQQTLEFQRYSACKWIPR